MRSWECRVQSFRKSDFHHRHLLLKLRLSETLHSAFPTPHSKNTVENPGAFFTDYSPGLITDYFSTLSSDSVSSVCSCSIVFPSADAISATFMKPMNISWKDWGPQWTRLVGSGLGGFLAELSCAPVQRSQVPAGIFFGSVRRYSVCQLKSYFGTDRRSSRLPFG